MYAMHRISCENSRETFTCFLQLVIKIIKDIK